MWNAIIPIVAFYLGWSFLLFNTKTYDRPTKFVTYTVIAGIAVSALLLLFGPKVLPTQEVLISQYSLVEMGAHNAPQGNTVYVQPYNTDEGLLYTYIPKESGLAGSLSEYASRTQLIYTTALAPQVRRYVIEPKFKWMKLLTQFDDQGRLVLIIPPGGAQAGGANP